MVLRGFPQLCLPSMFHALSFGQHLLLRCDHAHSKCLTNHTAVVRYSLNKVVLVTAVREAVTGSSQQPQGSGALPAAAPHTRTRLRPSPEILPWSGIARPIQRSQSSVCGPGLQNQRWTRGHRRRQRQTVCQSVSGNLELIDD